MEASLSDRARAIARCTEEIAECQGNYARYPDEKWSIAVGEVDWLAELHKLLYEE